MGTLLAVVFGAGAIALLLAIFKIVVVDAENDTNRALGVVFVVLAVLAALFRACSVD